jgi:hypothetical protein
MRKNDLFCNWRSEAETALVLISEGLVVLGKTNMIPRFYLFIDVKRGLI